MPRPGVRGTADGGTAAAAGAGVGGDGDTATGVPSLAASGPMVDERATGMVSGAGAVGTGTDDTQGAAGGTNQLRYGWSGIVP